MNSSERQSHWQTIYSQNKSQELSWFQDYPRHSMKRIEALALAKSAPIIDVGGGDSFLADSLLKEGYSQISVLDISEQALYKSKQRLADQSAAIKWFPLDILHFEANQKYQLWHDRAVFHFFDKSEDIQRYLEIAANSLVKGGHLIIATFSKKGPQKCSGLTVQQYDEEALKNVFSPYFKLMESEHELHLSPAGKKQDFIFAHFQRK